MKLDIKNYLKKYQSCQLNKTDEPPTKAPMEITTTTMQPLERIFIDIVGKLPKTINDSEQLLTIQNYLTKFTYTTYRHRRFKISSLRIKLIYILSKNRETYCRC